MRQYRISNRFFQYLKSGHLLTNFLDWKTLLAEMQILGLRLLELNIAYDECPSSLMNDNFLHND